MASKKAKKNYNSNFLQALSIKFLCYSVLFLLSNLFMFQHLQLQLQLSEMHQSTNDNIPNYSYTFTDNHESVKFLRRGEAKKHFIPEDGFAGCLVLKDDNDRLSEWLAYHWLILPLKYLVVAIDPTGTTSPELILQLWNNSNMGMDIILWNDVDYDHWIDETLDELHQHRARQEHLYAKCLKYHKERNRSWVALIDPDEYITYNWITEDDPEIEDIRGTPEMFLDHHYLSAMESIRRNLPPQQRKQKTVFDYLQEGKGNEPWMSEPCHLISRLFFSAVEEGSRSNSDVAKDMKQHVTGELDLSRFSTLRYFHHANRGKFDYNHYGKVIIDLSRINSTEISMNMQSIHTPIQKCPKTPLKPYSASILRIHHYIGSWEQYSSRFDIRRSKKKFDDFSTVDEGVDYQLESWLTSFVDIVGVSTSLKLLEHTGIVDVVNGTVPLLERKEYVRVSPPPIYYVYYYNSKHEVIEKKILQKDSFEAKTFEADEIVPDMYI